MKFGFFASRFSRDGRPWRGVSPWAGFAGFMAVFIWFAVTLRLIRDVETWWWLALIGVGGLPAGFAAGLITRAAWPVVRNAAPGIGVLAVLPALVSFHLGGVPGIGVVAVAWLVVMCSIFAGALIAKPLCRDTSRKRRARRWPHYAQHARRPR